MTLKHIEEIILKHLKGYRHKVCEILGSPSVVVIMTRPMWWDIRTKIRIKSMIREIDEARSAHTCIEYCYWR